MNVDIDQLQEELHEIDRQRHEVTERIRDYGVRGRGRGGFGFPQRPFHGPGGASGEDTGTSSSSRHEPIPSFNEKFGNAIGVDPQRRSRGDSTFTRPGRPSENDRYGRQGSYQDGGGPPRTAAPYNPLDRSFSGHQNGRSRPPQSRPSGDEPAGAAALPGPPLPGPPLPGPPPLPAVPPKKKVLSAAVVVGSSLAADAEMPEEPAVAKRPREEREENPAMKKRNKRMFGALLGTLQRFKDEDAAAKRSRIALQREQALKRADVHAAEELIRARDHERQQAAKARMAELNRKRELNAAAELKRAEIILARRYAHQAMLAKFLRTAAQPQLLWAPAKHCADTILLEEQRQLELAVWMDKEKARLEENRSKVIDRTKAIIAQAEKMRNAPVAGRPGQQQEPTEGDGGKKGDAEMAAADGGDNEHAEEHGNMEADEDADEDAGKPQDALGQGIEHTGKVDAGDRYEAESDADMQPEQQEDNMEQADADADAHAEDNAADAAIGEVGDE